MEDMTTEQRDNILKLARKHYEYLGCNFCEDDREMIEYLYESEHPDEQRCILMAIEAHNLYNNDSMTLDEFFEWHGL